MDNKTQVEVGSRAWLLALQEETFKNIIELTKKKNADYAGAGGDAFNNFNRIESISSRISTEQGFVVRMTDKLGRIGSLIDSGEYLVKDESVEDTLLDLSNYAFLFYAYLRAKKLKATQEGPHRTDKDMPATIGEDLNKVIPSTLGTSLGKVLTNTEELPPQIPEEVPYTQESFNLLQTNIDDLKTTSDYLRRENKELYKDLDKVTRDIHILCYVLKQHGITNEFKRMEALSIRARWGLKKLTDMD